MSDLAYCFPRGGAVEFSVRLDAPTISANVGRTEKTRLKRNAGGNVRKLPMMVPLPLSDNSIGTNFIQNQSASPAFLIRHLPADKRKFCKVLHHRCLRSNATFPPGEGIRSIVQSTFFDTLNISGALHPRCFFVCEMVIRTAVLCHPEPARDLNAKDGVIAKKPYFCKALEILRCAQDDTQAILPALCCARLGDKFLKKIQGSFVADENFLVNFAVCRKFSFVEIPS